MKIVRVTSLIRRALQAASQATIGQLENYVTARQGQPAFPPIFIIGPARSGTTLIYQTIAYSLHVSYLSNLMVAFPEAPSLTAKFTSYMNGCNAPRSFSSKYGKTSGWRSPAQGYQVWNRWFPKEGEGTGKIDWSEQQQARLAGTVASIERSYNAPFINKWPGFSVNILPLLNALPESLFIKVQRDPLQNIQSILKGRYELTGKPDVSISRVPKGYSEYADRDYIEQVCAYFLGVERQINQDSKIVGVEKVLTIKYEEFCLNPSARLRDIREWYSIMTGYELKMRNDYIPPTFIASQTQKVSTEELLALQACLQKLSSEFDFIR
jgi:hypothetical protein